VPDVPIPVAPPADNTVKVSYYGTEVTVHIDKSKAIKLGELSGETLSAAWTALSDGSYDAMLADCLNAKKTLGVGDWGYISLVEKVAKSVSDANEAVFLQR
jgi:hypothetical protein